MHANATTSAPTMRPHAEGGFSIFEVLIGATILAVALLGHTASIFSEHRLSEGERARSTAILAAEQFLERLRSDDEWPTLYNRLHTLRALSAGAPGGSVKAVLREDWFSPEALLAAYEMGSADHAFLQDGSLVYPPTVYYDDFVSPTGLHSLHFLVEVPAAPLNTDLTGAPVLREDLALDAFAMPADLNGDGSIDDAAHDTDYLAIPIVVHIRFSHSDGKFEEFRISSWLWGYR